MKDFLKNLLRIFKNLERSWKDLWNILSLKIQYKLTHINHLINQVSWQLLQIESLQPPPLPPKHHIECGKDPNDSSTISKRIIGGQDTAHHEFPWQTAMVWRNGRDEGKHICGGSLIARRFVLTAAHCFDHGEVKHYYKIILGRSTSLSIDILILLVCRLNIALSTAK